MPSQPLLHKNNRHQARYDLPALCQTLPELKQHLIEAHGNQTIDFSNDAAVKALNQALLMHFYNIQFWQIPDGFLCPAIPGRADYIHHLSDLIQSTLSEPFNKGKKVKVLDIGVGANCVYPIIGIHEYGWQFVGSDINPVSVKTAQTIARTNPAIARHLKIKQQKGQGILEGIIGKKEFFTATICNPPFHNSIEAANKGTQRKLSNLEKNKQKRGSTDIKAKSSDLNFAGQGSELWCPGGELSFIQQYIKESHVFAGQCAWFSCLVSKKDNLDKLKKSLKQQGVEQVKQFDMAQGNKQSRFIAWSYFQQQELKEIIL
ncbi:23S rRNA (adenine(1618)-N(6))-methyltransferase RlmF [Catenovulum sp. SM1970]|uniref:23S rRNA (adenine(1618)-N(6))-methyltransferase RlmF n=1 Tax=Marinifaba aquimaris TaxID=2741323 RepID=UPI001574616E|nr:23S rRNA (adenine(1618)-N(6))-methyltransferase RlmF [Marinifaba aquimaris]NTS76099.1 23S rRNA (adenine(1618)-N(6))-methyltransferase RlmF [Marinifaba aquimaris]